MKKTLSIVFAATFVFLLFVSCQKEKPTSDNQESSLRTVTAVFENNGTKTTLDSDGFTPLWSVGDEILLLNDYTTEKKTIAAENILDNKLIFTTNLGGVLYAVYPASATSMHNYSSGDFIVDIPFAQDGTFGSANISVAKGTNIDNNVSLIFSNVASVLEFSQTATTGVKKVQVRAANAIAGPLAISFGTDNKVNSVTTTGLTTKTIIANSSSALDKFYVAVAPVTTGKIEFKYSKDPLNVAPYTDGTGKTLARNKIYGGANLSMDGKTYGLDYVTIAAKYDGMNVSELKWGTENLAITTSGKKEFNNTGHINGDYFQWGAYAGYCGESTDSDKGLLLYNSFSSKACGDDDNVIDYKSSGTGQYIFDAFAHYDDRTNIAPYSSGPGTYQYCKYNDGYLTALEKSDDVASTILSGNWRMPTAQEFVAMKAVTYWRWGDFGLYVFAPHSEEDVGKYGTIWTADNSYKLCDALLFFPASGHITGAGLVDSAEPYASVSYGHYLTNTIYNNNNYYASCLFYFYDGIECPAWRERDSGNTIRPVSD